MEGLLIDQLLRRLAPHLPAERLAWRFADPYTFSLPLRGLSLTLYLRPPEPYLALDDAPPGGPHTSFQQLLAARAGGALVAAEQLKLDRVVRFRFAGAGGFVPTPPVSLIAELTGRHCNLILLDDDGVILGAAREVGADINRYRQIRAGLRYTPPPPYDKLDPRSADDAALAQALSGQRLKRLPALLDGFGPKLSAALARLSGLGDRPVSAAEARALVPLVRQVVAEPDRVLRDTLGAPDIAALRQQAARAELEAQLRAALEQALALTERQLEDVAKARAAAQEAEALRQEAELLLSYAQQVPKGATQIVLEDFSGQPRTIALEPQLSPLENAQLRYARAKKREQRREQAEARAPQLAARRQALAQQLATLGELSDEALAALKQQLVPDAPHAKAALPGLKFRGPHGFEILVGRNAKENEMLTFKVAKSRDVWLHAQGYRGAHVIIRAENREVPFDTIAAAAQLAAGYSKAAASENVPVDYTLRKHVWRPKGGAPGAVHYTQQKTLYVTPRRHLAG